MCVDPVSALSDGHQDPARDPALCLRCGLNPRPPRRNWQSVNAHMAATGNYRLEPSSHHHLCEDCYQQARFWADKLRESENG